MTALQTRRRRRTVLGGFAATVLMVVALAATVVGALTLRDSEEGESVAIDTRQVVRFPTTPNLALALADDEGHLAALVVTTLLPDGRGGSVVTVPVNADATAGLGPERQPINSVFSPDDPEAFAEVVESLLSITIERLEIVDAARLAGLIAPVTPIDIELPAAIIDSSDPGSGIVVAAGEQTLDSIDVAAALSAVDESGDLYDNHPQIVDLWSALAANASGEPPSAPADGEGPLAPTGTDEFVERLWSGPVEVRDLDVDPGLAALAENAGGLDLVVIDRRDSLLVFTQASPSLVSTPNDGLTFRLEVRFSEEQLAAGDDVFTSRSQVTRTLVGELLFLSANVVSVDPAGAVGGAPAITRIEVAEERFVDDMVEFAPLIFGEAEVIVAPIVLDGVDVVVKLGTGYLDAQRQRRTGDTVEGE